MKRASLSEFVGGEWFMPSFPPADDRGSVAVSEGAGSVIRGNGTGLDVRF